MAVPESVRKAAEQADLELNKVQDGDGLQETAAQAAAQETQPVEPNEQAPNANQEPPKPQETVAMEEYNRVKNELERVNQSFKTLQGKYSAEIPRMAEEMRMLRDQVADISRRPPEPPKPEKPAYLRHVKDEEIQDVDKTLLDMQGRMAKGVAEDEVSKVRAEAARLKNDLSNQMAELQKSVSDARQRAVWAEVEKAHPGAFEMDSNGDQEWLSFLETTDELTGMTHKDIGARALSGGNSERIVRLLDKFKASSGASQRVPPAVQQQVKPRTSRVETGTRTPQKPMVKESEIKTLASEITKGIWKDRRKEADEKMRAFDEAVAEGRVLFGQ